MSAQGNTDSEIANADKGVANDDKVPHEVAKELHGLLRQCTKAQVQEFLGVFDITGVSQLKSIDERRARRFIDAFADDLPFLPTRQSGSQLNAEHGPARAPLISLNSPREGNMMNNYPAKNEVAALLREAYAINALPDGAVSRWMAAHGLDLNLHAAWGSVMALPTNAPGPLWAQYNGKHWCDAGLRLLAPLCGTDGVVRSFVAQSVTPDYHGAAVPDGRSHEGLVVACPTARRILLNGANLYRVVITGSFRTWLRRAEAARRRMEGVCVVGLLPGSWTREWENRLAGAHVTLLREPDATHLNAVQDALKARAQTNALTFNLSTAQEAA